MRSPQTRKYLGARALARWQVQGFPARHAAGTPPAATRRCAPLRWGSGTDSFFWYCRKLEFTFIFCVATSTNSLSLQCKTKSKLRRRLYQLDALQTN